MSISQKETTNSGTDLQRDRALNDSKTTKHTTSTTNNNKRTNFTIFDTTKTKRKNNEIYHKHLSSSTFGKTKKFTRFQELKLLDFSKLTKKLCSTYASGGSRLNLQPNLNPIFWKHQKSIWCLKTRKSELCDTNRRNVIHI